MSMVLQEQFVEKWAEDALQLLQIFDGRRRTEGLSSHFSSLVRTVVLFTVWYYQVKFCIDNYVHTESRVE